MLLELTGDMQDFVPVPGALLRAQCQLQRGNVASGFLLQPPQHGKGLIALPQVDEHFGLEHQARRLHRRVGLQRALEPHLLLGRLVQALRRTRGEQRRKPRPLPALEDLGREFQRLTVAPLKSQARDVVVLSGELLALTPRTVFAHALRKREHQRDAARKPVEHEKRAHDQNKRQIQRDLGAIRRHDEQDVALVVMGGQRNADGQRKQREQPEQNLHHRLPLTAPPRRP